MSARVQVRRLTTADAFLDHCGAVGADLPFDPVVTAGAGAPLAAPCAVGGHRLANRFAVLPMEGWDGSADGRPTELVRRRWRRFGASGAALVWGGEAVAVRPDGRANPHQLLISAETVGDLATLRQELVAEHRSHAGGGDGPLVGLQLTHSGRFARPDGDPAPLVAYRHPILDGWSGSAAVRVLDDADLDQLADDFVTAARHAASAGFAFVDVKCCHGYLGHELLSAVDRPGRYGGDLAGRTAFVRLVVARIREELPELSIGVRLSAFDLVPFRAGPDGRGDPEPLPASPYRYAFGGDGTGRGVDLTEPAALVDALADAGVSMVCVTGGSPYYCPHAQRPAFFPPTDGYSPPEDPLVGVTRLHAAAARLKAHRPELLVVGSGYSYLQEWLPHVAQAAVARGDVDMVGIGRMALSYPALPADVLHGRPLDRRLLCRTFSDCTSAPRAGLVSGCYPLDDFYSARPERRDLAAAKRRSGRRARA